MVAPLLPHREALSASGAAQLVDFFVTSRLTAACSWRRSRAAADADAVGLHEYLREEYMADPYFRNLLAKIQTCGSPTRRGVTLECRHFFSGAALYANGTICASLTPVGFAVKLPEESRAALLREGRARPLRYFKEGPIKKEYVVLSAAAASKPAAVRALLRASIRYATRGK